MDDNGFKDQAEYIWNRLDDLAKTDPSSYKKFIEKQMEEHRILTSAPEPIICLHTVALGGESTDLFVNICSWKRMPYPENVEEPIKLFSGEKTMKKSKSGHKEIIIPVAINEKIYEECMDTDLDRNRLFEIILDSVEDNLKIKISRNFKKYKEIYKGDLPANPRSLFLSRSQISSESNIEKIATETPVNTPEELLKRLSTTDESRTGSEKSKIDPKIELDKMFGRQEKDSGKKNLIQEIGGEETNGADSRKLPRPEHALTEMPGNDKKPARYVLKIQLPLMSSVAECELVITENSVELIAEDKYYLLIELQHIISEDSSSAKFSKKTHCLTLSLPYN